MVAYDKLIDLDRLSAFKDKCDDEYAKIDVEPDTAKGILYASVDSTSTATEFTAQIPGVTSYYDGLIIVLRNGVVTSASGFTININGLGALPVYNNMATGNDITPTAPTRDTTIFNINYTMIFTYVASDIVEGGCWICWRGYDANTNTIGYQLRTNSTAMKTAIRSRYYRIFFTAADNIHWEPANTGYDNSATSAKTVNTRPINPFGRIVYTSANTNYTAESTVAATTIWDRYALNLGYSFNKTGAALTMTYPAPVYVKCAPQSDGSAVIDSTTPTVQALPSTNDGKIYIFLGMAYSATNIELVDWHPIYWHDGTGIRKWTGATSSGGVTSVNGQTGAVTLSIPSKTSDLTNDSGFITDAGVTSFNGSTGAVTYTAPVTSVNGSTGAVTVSVPSASTTNPSMDGTASYGSGTDYARANHVHPTDTSRQATLVSGSNIKTINNESILGSGNISISVGGNYLPLSGGTMTGGIEFSTPDQGDTIRLGDSFKYIDFELTQRDDDEISIGAHRVKITNPVIDQVNDSTITSGSKLPIVGSGYLRRSSLTFGTSTTTFLRNDGTWQTPGMTILSYGSSTWAEAEAAFLANNIVYCRASSNSNPATGTQGRMAFLAYTNSSTAPTEFEFQYYRSVATHTDAQQGDQVYVYKLNKTSGWSVTTREAYTKVVAGTGLSSSYANGAITLTATGGGNYLPTVDPDISPNQSGACNLNFDGGDLGDIYAGSNGNNASIIAMEIDAPDSNTTVSASIDANSYAGVHTGIMVCSDGNIYAEGKITGGNGLWIDDQNGIMLSSVDDVGGTGAIDISTDTLLLDATNYVISDPSAFLTALGLTSANGVSF